MPLSIPYYKKARTNKIIGFSFLAPAVVFIAAGSQPAKISNPGDNSKRGYVIAGILSCGTVVFCLTRSLNYNKKAIKVHNEHLHTIY